MFAFQRIQSILFPSMQCFTISSVQCIFSGVNNFDQYTQDLGFFLGKYVNSHDRVQLFVHPTGTIILNAAW